MKSILIVLSAVVLRCCWAPTDFCLMRQLQEDNTLLKELNGKYNITELNDEDVSSFKLNMVFNKEKKEVSGFSGCNQFFGSYTLDRYNLKMNSFGLTKMLCKEHANSIETKLIKVFEKANLVLFTKNGFKIYSKKKLLITAIKKNSNDDFVFEYSKLSRGSHKLIKVDKSTILISDKRSSNFISSETKKEDWDKLSLILRGINLDVLSGLEPPSKNHQFDGASLAHFKIILNDKVYKMQAFDHGNPHSIIEPLVKEILSMSENIE